MFYPLSAIHPFLLVRFLLSFRVYCLSTCLVVGQSIQFTGKKRNNFFGHGLLILNISAFQKSNLYKFPRPPQIKVKTLVRSVSEDHSFKVDYWWSHKPNSNWFLSDQHLKYEYFEIQKWINVVLNCKMRRICCRSDFGCFAGGNRGSRKLLQMFLKMK